MTVRPGEDRLREQVARVMEKTYLSDDVNVAKIGLIDIENAHGFTHMLLEDALEDDDVDPAIKEAMLTIHIAIEYLELLTIDHIRRLENPDA